MYHDGHRLGHLGRSLERPVAHYDGFACYGVVCTVLVLVYVCDRVGSSLTQPHAAVLQQVAEVVKHGLLVLTADAAEVAQEATAVGHHLGEPDLLQNGGIQDSVSQSLLCSQSGLVHIRHR